MSNCFPRLNTLDMVPFVTIEYLVKFQVTLKWEQIFWSELFSGNIHLVTDLINRIVQVLRGDLYWFRISAQDAGLMEPVKPWDEG